MFQVLFQMYLILFIFYFYISIVFQLYRCLGNFGGNQLLDGSISLSPLYPSRAIDLHVRIAADLHQSFLWLHPARA